MRGYAYYNGKVGQCDEISIPLTDRIIYFGDGVYDVMIGHDGGIFMVWEHLCRLRSNMDALHIEYPADKDRLYDLICRLILLSGYKSYSIYISVSRDSEEREHSYRNSRAANLLIIIKEFSLPDGAALSLITEEDKRYGYCNIKTVNLLPAVLYSTKAEAYGCDEAVLHRGGTVTECAHSNVFILKGGRLITHPKCELILPGITRELLIGTAKEMGISTDERPFSLGELFSADEIIVTSTTKLVRHTTAIDGLDVGGKDKTSVEALEHAVKEKYLNM